MFETEYHGNHVIPGRAVEIVTVILGFVSTELFDK